MKTIQLNLYTFDELGDDAKDKARDWYRGAGLDYDWSEHLVDEAATLGLKITSFDIDRGRHCDGEFTKSAVDVANAIIANHGEACETRQTACKFLYALNAVDMDCVDSLDAIEENESEFLKSLLEDYSILLQHEYEYICSNESVDENILCNEYTFTDKGVRYG